MTWTTERPDKSGLYWFRGGIYSSSDTKERDLLNPEVVRIYAPRKMDDIVSQTVETLENDVIDTIEHWRGEWAGPIKPPEG